MAAAARPPTAPAHLSPSPGALPAAVTRGRGRSTGGWKATMRLSRQFRTWRSSPPTSPSFSSRCGGSPAGAPGPGTHKSFRGGPVATYDGETRAALAEMHDGTDIAAAPRCGRPPWRRHGRRRGLDPRRRCADEPPDRRRTTERFIDFGSSAVGNPACDLIIAWTFLFADRRDAFRRRVGLDSATWARARRWALWKALVTLAPARASNPEGRDVPALRLGWRQSPAAVIDDVIADPGTLDRDRPAPGELCADRLGGMD